MKKIRYLALFLALSMTVSCDEGPSFPEDVKIISVFGVLNTARSRQEVYVAKVHALEENPAGGNVQSLETAIEGATVVIEGEELSEPLTDRGGGRYDGRVIVEPGKSYTLLVQTPDGQFARAETTVPPEPILIEETAFDTLEVTFDLDALGAGGSLTELNPPRRVEWLSGGPGCTYQFKLIASNGFFLAGHIEPDLELNTIRLFDPILDENERWIWAWFPSPDHPQVFSGQVRITVYDRAISDYEYYGNFQRVPDSNIDGGIGYFGSVVTSVRSVVFVENVVE